MKRIKNIISALIILGLALVIVWLLASFRVYKAFSKEEFIASVSCQKSREPSFDYIIFYKPVSLKEPLAYGIKGNQWRLEGVVIKWKGFVNILGIHTWHKTVRLSGRFSNLTKHEQFGTTDYVLNNGEDSFWKFIYTSSKLLPFIEAAYGSGTFMPCRENVVYKIYVTTSGYIVKTDNR